MREMTRQPDEQETLEAHDKARALSVEAVRSYLRSFSRRGRLDLERDRSKHRRFTALYDDLQN